MVLLQVVIALQTRCNELGVVDHAVLVGIDHVDSVGKFVLINVDLWDGIDAGLQLFWGQLSISILVHLAEGLSQGSDLILRDTGRNKAECGSLELESVHVLSHVGEDLLGDLHILELLLLLAADPWMVIGLLGGQSLISLSVEETADQVFGLV